MMHMVYISTRFYCDVGLIPKRLDIFSGYELNLTEKKNRNYQLYAIVHMKLRARFFDSRAVYTV